MSCSKYAGGSTPPGLTCFPASQELAVSRNHVFSEEIVYSLFHSRHSYKIVNFELYVMAVIKRSYLFDAYPVTTFIPAATVSSPSASGCMQCNAGNHGKAGLLLYPTGIGQDDERFGF